MRSVVLFTLFTFASFYGFAQSNYNITAGYTLSTLVDDEGRTFESQDVRGKLFSLPSAYIGFSAEKPTHSPVSVRFELNYTAAGGILQADLRNVGFSFTSRVEFHQVQFPVVVRYRLTDKFHLYTGAYLGAQFFTRYRYIFYSQSITLPFDFGKKMKREMAKATNRSMHPVSMGVFGGVDYTLTRRFNLTARYNYTFTNMSREPDTGLKMHFLQTGLSYRLNRTPVLKKNEF